MSSKSKEKKLPVLKGKRTYIAVAGAIVSAVARPALRAVLPPESADILESFLTEEVAAALTASFGTLAIAYRKAAQPTIVFDTQHSPSSRPKL